MENKKDLLKIAKDMDLKGISKLTKKELAQFIIQNPCTNLTIDECNKKTRDELRVIARKCNIKITKKQNHQVCDEIITKFKNVKPKLKTPQKLKTPDPEWETETIETGTSKVIETPMKEPDWMSSLLADDEPIQIKTDKTPKEVIKQVIKSDFDKLIANRKSNFTDTLKLSKSNLSNTDCKLHITSVKEIDSSGVSGAGIFSAILKQSKNDVIIKIWKVDEKHIFRYDELLSCLNGEWNIYTYIVPFIFDKKLSPNVLVPIDSGICHVKEMKERIQNIHMTQTDIAKYITTAYVPDSLNDFMYTNKPKDMTDIYFQTLYTLTAFSKIGLRHNDIHTGNVRILECPKNPFKIAYKLKNRTIYCKTPHLCLVNDFDRSGISPSLSKKFNIKNLCTEEKGFQCKIVHQCNTNDAGRRDLVTFSYYILNKLPKTMRLYVLSDILCPTKAAQLHFAKNIVFDVNNATIDYSKSNNHDFLYYKLTDKQVNMMYQPIETVINSDDFINLCVKYSPNLTLKMTVKDERDFDVYNYNG